MAASLLFLYSEFCLPPLPIAYSKIPVAGFSFSSAPDHLHPASHSQSNSMDNIERLEAAGEADWLLALKRESVIAPLAARVTSRLPVIRSEVRRPRFLHP